VSFSRVTKCRQAYKVRSRSIYLFILLNYFLQLRSNATQPPPLPLINTIPPQTQERTRRSRRVLPFSSAPLPYIALLPTPFPQHLQQMEAKGEERGTSRAGDGHEWYVLSSNIPFHFTNYDNRNPIGDKPHPLQQRRRHGESDTTLLVLSLSSFRQDGKGLSSYAAFPRNEEV
jgi:hypothetical protein